MNNPSPAKAPVNDPPVRYTQEDRTDLINAVLLGGIGGVFRKHARIVAMQENQPFIVETAHGPVRGEAGDWIATNHPEDGDPTSDVWPIEDVRMAATYHPADLPVITEVVTTPPAVLIRSAIEQLRQPDGRGADRHDSLAITKLEEAILWLNGGTVIGE